MVTRARKNKEIAKEKTAKTKLNDNKDIKRKKVPNLSQEKRLKTERILKKKR